MVFLGAACGDAGAEADEGLDVGEGDVLGGDFVIGGAVVVIAEGDAQGGGAMAEELVGGGLAGAAGHEAALDGDVGLHGDVAEGGGGGGIEDAGAVADAEDGTIADFCGGALGTGLDGDERDVIWDEAGGGEFHGADEADLLGAGEEGEARAFRAGGLEFHERGDDCGAADEVIAGAGVDEAIADAELG